MMAMRTILAGLVLTAIVGWMIAGRIVLLQSGREIVVASHPIDARELFRGDYIGLSYDFSNLKAASISGIDAGGRLGETTIYAVLKSQDGRYRLDYATTTKPAVSADRVILRGKVDARSAGSGSGALSPSFGIERYFVPDGQGRGLPSQIAGHGLDVVLAVDADGDAAIKALRLDGQDIYREGLF